MYADGWNVIGEKIAHIIAEVNTVNDFRVGKVHFNIPNVREISLSDYWRSQFVHDGMVNTWIVYRRSPLGETLSDLYPAYSTRRHDVEIQGFYSFVEDKNTIFDWDNLVDSVVNAFVRQERTLGGSCLTYSLPRISDSGILGNFLGVNVHSCTMTMTVEEVYLI